MATIGQVVYNLQDFHSSGGLVSTDETNSSVTISSVMIKGKDDNGNDIYEANPDYERNKINIFGKENNQPDAEDEDIVQKFGGGPFTKLGIQAPPGTKVKINKNKIILIGRTGVYEADEDIKITALQFDRPKKYVVDNKATQQSLEQGSQGLNDAEEERRNSLATLDAEYTGKDKDEEYWSKYTNIQDKYQKKYNVARAQYIAGVNGIYVLPTDIDPDASPNDNYEELYNVIIDFLY